MCAVTANRVKLYTKDRTEDRTKEQTATGSVCKVPSLGEHSIHVTEERLKKMLSRAEGARQAKMTEPVHPIRVWSRRCLAALSLCTDCFGGPEFPELKRTVKLLSDALGEACDLDMMIDTTCKWAETLAPAQRPAAREFLEHLAHQRHTLQTSLLEAATELESQDLLRRFEEAVRSRRGKGKERYRRGKLTSSQEQPTPLFVYAARTISVRCRAVRGYERYLYYPEKVEELHRMRLAIKRLRYTMELFEPVYLEHSYLGEEFHTVLEQVQFLQERLGQIHDADILAPRLMRFVADRLRDGCGGKSTSECVSLVHHADLEACRVLLTVGQQMRLERDRHYRQFLEEWQHVREQRLLEDLCCRMREAADREGGDE